MSEKIGEEMKKKLIDGMDVVIDNYGAIDWEASNELTEKNWRAAGLLEPEENVLEKARREWAQVQDARGYSEQRIRGAANIYIRELEARLKASAWTREDARWYGEYCWQQGRKWNSDIQTPAEWLAQRKAGKGAE